MRHRDTPDTAPGSYGRRAAGRVPGDGRRAEAEREPRPGTGADTATGTGQPMSAKSSQVVDRPSVGPRTPPPRTRRVIASGLTVVLSAAAVLSFAALRDLAVAVRIHRELAWLLPIAVDAGAAVSCAAWLSPHSPRDAARFARGLTWGLLTLTVAGNATAQGMAAAGLVPPWWVAVLVGAIPPAVVGGVVHLAVLVGRTPATWSAPDRVGEDTRTAIAPADQLTAPTTDPTMDQTDDALIRRLIEWAERETAVPSRERVRVEFGIGSRRATRLREAVRTIHDRGETA